MAYAALPDDLIERLQHRIGEPLRKERADHDAVPHDAFGQIQHSVIFDQFSEPGYYNPRL
jgi:hypothetical protein